MKYANNSTDRRTRRASFDSSSITADDILAAGRAFARYINTTDPREYIMRFFENGSVYLHAPAHPNNSQLLSLDDINAEACWFHLNPHRPLWRHILCIWE